MKIPNASKKVHPVASPPSKMEKKESPFSFQASPYPSALIIPQHLRTHSNSDDSRSSLESGDCFPSENHNQETVCAKTSFKKGASPTYFSSKPIQNSCRCLEKVVHRCIRGVCQSKTLKPLCPCRFIKKIHVHTSKKNP